MIRKLLLSSAVSFGLVGLMAGASHATLIYDYSGSTGSGFTLNGSPTTLADFGTLAPLPTGQTWSVTSFAVARATGTTAGSFDVGYFLWNNVNTNAAAGTSVFSNLLASGSFNRTATTTAGVTITTITLGTPLTLQGGQTFGIQMEYAAPGTINTTTAAYTPNTLGVTGFLVDQGTSLAGNSTNAFFANSSATGIVQSTDSTGLASPNQAFGNVYLQINANVVGTAAAPEPSAVALSLSGAMLMVGGIVRRRRARA